MCSLLSNKRINPTRRRARRCWLYWTAGLLVMFELIAPLETIHVALQAPLGVQEMILAVWLIAHDNE